MVFIKSFTLLVASSTTQFFAFFSIISDQHCSFSHQGGESKILRLKVFTPVNEVLTDKVTFEGILVPRASYLHTRTELAPALSEGKKRPEILIHLKVYFHH